MSVKWMMRVGIAIGLAACLSACQKKQVEPVKVVAPEGKDEVRAVIGPAGGELHFAGKGAWLEIPKGLLQEEVSLTLARVPPSFDLAAKDFVGCMYQWIAICPVCPVTSTCRCTTTTSCTRKDPTGLPSSTTGNRSRWPSSRASALIRNT